MIDRANPGGVLRFGDFELDVAGYELRDGGRPVRLERQPMDLLLMLVERRGQLVSREEIVDRLWGKNVFVDVDAGVHTAVRKIRRALRDSPEKPVFVETVSGKGYRFIADRRDRRATIGWGGGQPTSMWGSSASCTTTWGVST